ncbi:MAG: hypothetical protein PVG25_06630, partial [Anaerolineae bacterium]
MMSNSTLALVGGRLIDGTGREPVPRATVVVEGRAISQVGPADEIDVPEGCQVIDCTGKTMMPGMIDCHCHVSLTTMDIKARLLTRKTVQVFRT